MRGYRGAPEALAVSAGRVGRRYGMVGVGAVGAGVMYNHVSMQ